MSLHQCGTREGRQHERLHRVNAVLDQPPLRELGRVQCAAIQMTVQCPAGASRRDLWTRSQRVVDVGREGGGEEEKWY